MKDSRYPILNVPIVGTISEFGGPNDTGMTDTEGLALYEKATDGGLFLPESSRPFPGLGRSLNPDAFYCAMRFNYDLTPKIMLLDCMVIITHFVGTELYKVGCKISDWGPAPNTGRLIDISPGAMKALNAKTDDLVVCCLVQL